MRSGKFHEFTGEELLRTAHESLVRVSITGDRIPGGLSAAMTPVLVDWGASSVGFGRDDFLILRNVNVSSNPVAGDLVLGCVRVPVGGIERIEWVFVVSKLGHSETRGGHAMIRFVFEDGRRPVVVSSDGDALGHHLELEDLVLSWEAWRPPLAGFDPVAGLDPETYALTLRCLHGPVRCLSDTIFDRPWECYPIRLPDLPHAADEMLHTCLLFGDALARHTIGALLEERIDEEKHTPEGYEHDDVQTWETIREELRRNAVPDYPIDEILQGKTRYQLLERSCVTMALTMLDAANVRICRDAGLGDPARVRVVPGELPAFLGSLARGERRNALLGLPGALYWLANHQTVIPGKAHELLDEVGLLQQQDGRAAMAHYDNRKNTPYGRLEEHLIY